MVIELIAPHACNKLGGGQPASSSLSTYIVYDAGSAWPLRMTAAKSRHGHAEAAAGAVGVVALALGLACAAGSPSPILRQVQATPCLTCCMYVAAFQLR